MVCVVSQAEGRVHLGAAKHADERKPALMENLRLWRATAGVGGAEGESEGALSPRSSCRKSRGRDVRSSLLSFNLPLLPCTSIKRIAPGAAERALELPPSTP
jgi:hypothetical protein